MKVREVLTPLVMPALQRLCRERDLSVNGTKHEVLTRLARSYHGNLSAVVDKLRKKDLLNIASALSDSVEFPPRLQARRVSELRKVFQVVFGGRNEAPN